ncbi:MAG TPA: hypothetical protein VEW71_02100 [Allosphingosinicella sp.]|nr:hypothetical protein [Allosphingosinicella sp.]
MRPAAILVPALLFLMSACANDGPSNAIVPQNEAAAPPKAAAPAVENAIQPPVVDAPAPGIPDDPGLAGMSATQRRAYERGYRDCSAGRYEPEHYPEAYRIGCSAAEDRKAGRRPEG